MPALIFLHGSAGNFLSYTYVLSGLAQSEHMVLIAPSYGFGSWVAMDRSTSWSAFESTRSTTSGRSPAHLSRGFVAGRRGREPDRSAIPRSLSRFIFISPVIDGASLRSEGWRDLDLLFPLRPRDERIPAPTSSTPWTPRRRREPVSAM